MFGSNLKGKFLTKKIVEACIRKGVLIQPGIVYGTENGFRLTFASVGEEEILEGVSRLSRALRDLR